MSKVTMPEPDIFDGTRLDGSIASHGYSATALEAYAAAKVREAMKSLLHIMNGHGRAAHERFGESGKPYDEGRRTAYEQAAAEVRALIPPLPGPVEPTT